MRVGHWESPADPKAIPKIWRVMQGDGSGCPAGVGGVLWLTLLPGWGLLRKGREGD